MRVAALLLVLLLAGCSTMPPEGTDATPREQAPGPEPTLEPTPVESLWKTVVVDGVERAYYLHVPDHPGPMPLLLVLHGGFTSANELRMVSNLTVWADRGGFIVAFPQGTPELDGTEARLWNAIHCCGRAHTEDVDDVAFLDAVIDTVRRNHGVAPRDVVVAGHSNGAMMAYRLAAERSDRFSSVMVVAGTIGGMREEGAPQEVVSWPDHPVSALIIHARDDENVPFDGGTGNLTLEDGRIDLSVAESAAFWVEQAGLGSGNGTGDGAEVWQEDVVDHQRWGTAPGLEVQVVATEGGHGWPGGPSIPGVVQAPEEPKASEMVARFLLGHPKAG